MVAKIIRTLPSQHVRSCNDHSDISPFSYFDTHSENNMCAHCEFKMLSRLIGGRLEEELWQCLQDASRKLQSYSTAKSLRHLCKNAVK